MSGKTKADRKVTTGGIPIVVLLVVVVLALVGCGARSEEVAECPEVVECPKECPEVIVKVECPECPQTVVNVEAKVEEVGVAEIVDEIVDEVEAFPAGEGSLTLEGVAVMDGDGNICYLYAASGIGKTATVEVEVPEGERLVIDAWQIDPHGDGPWIQYWDGPANVKVNIVDGAACLSTNPSGALAHRQIVCSACQMVSSD